MGHEKRPGVGRHWHEAVATPGWAWLAQNRALLSEQLVTFIVSSQFNAVNPSCALITGKAWCYRVPKQNEIGFLSLRSLPSSGACKTCEPREREGPPDIRVVVEVWAVGRWSSEWGENKPQGELLCEEGPEEWARGML